MHVETENERLGAEYRGALKTIEESLAFWNAIGSGQLLSMTASEVLSDTWPPPTPDEAYGVAMVILDRLRGFRAAHGMP